MPNPDRTRQWIRTLSAGLILLVLISLPFLGNACRPVVPSSQESSGPSVDQTTTESAFDPSGPSTETTSTGSTESSATSISESSSDPSASGSETASESSFESSNSTDPFATQTGSSQSGVTGTGQVTTTTVWSSTSGATVPGTTIIQTTQSTVTQPPTTTRPVTQPPTTTAVQTTAATTAAPPSSNFPLHNYGTFFRNEYGTNANIISSADGGVQFDIGSTPQGVVLVKIISIPSATRCKVIVKGPGGTAYQYEVTSRNSFEGLPLQMGNGNYTATVYEQVGTSTSYSTKFAHTFSVTLGSSLRPYTASSIIVNFSTGSSSTSKASTLCSGKTNQVAKIEAVYLWIVNNITYDRTLAASITSGELKAYIPSPDRTMSTRKGICYDYAALMAAMLRSQGIPTRLIMGQVPQGYHAWNEVYLAGTGWVVIASFNYWQVSDSAWVMFDSTFAAGGVSSQTILNTTHTKERTY